MDATFGEGGHTRAILGAHTGNRVLALDRDAEALDAGRAALGTLAGRVDLVHSDYRDLKAVLARKEAPSPDGLIADLGVSTRQLLDPQRGFSFSLPGPLDMRLDRRRGGPTASDLIHTTPRAELQRLISRYGQEPHAAAISRAIVRRRARKPFTLTTDLAEVIAAAVPCRGPRRIHPATRTFQALRIAVNDELRDLSRFVVDAVEGVRAGGRVVFISFHSLEDRPVKKTLRTLFRPCICPPDLPVCGCGRRAVVHLLTPRVVRPGSAERAGNPACRSARLRAAEKCAA